MKIAMKKNQGFTLIEIIVVLIIVGVLAAIALPSLFANITKSKAGEALGSMSAMKANLEACGQKNNPATWASCGLPTTMVGSQGAWYYEMGSSTCSNLLANGNGIGDSTGWCIRASLGSASSSTHNIELKRNASGISCTGNGSFGGVC